MRALLSQLLSIFLMITLPCAAQPGSAQTPPTQATQTDSSHHSTYQPPQETEVFECPAIYDMACNRSTVLTVVVGTALVGGLVGACIGWDRHQSHHDHSSCSSSSASPTTESQTAQANAQVNTTTQSNATLSFTFSNAITIFEQTTFSGVTFIPIVVTPNGSVLTGNPIPPGGEDVNITVNAPSEVGTYQIIFYINSNDQTFASQAAVLVTNSLNLAGPFLYSFPLTPQEEVGSRITTEYQLTNN